MQYFSEPELKKLTQDVIELHHLDSGMGGRREGGSAYRLEEVGTTYTQMGTCSKNATTHVHVHACLGYGRGTCMYIHTCSKGDVRRTSVS